jgi:hypothetical protein
VNDYFPGGMSPQILTIFSFQFYSYDLLIACKDIGEGTLHIPELLGDEHIEPISTEGAYETKLDSKRVQNKQLLELLQRYTKRSSPFDVS